MPVAFGGWTAVVDVAYHWRRSRSSPGAGKPSTWRRALARLSIPESRPSLKGGIRLINPGIQWDDRPLWLARIQELLTLRSKQGKSFSRISDLLRLRKLWFTALDKVLSNKGARTPGVDGKSRRSYQEEAEKVLLINQILAEIKGRCYKPEPVRRIYIPKNPTEKRAIGIPTIKDRVVQEALRLILEPIYETKFHNHSYGFRPFRSTHHAIARVQSLISLQGYNWVIEGDIRKCFDRIDHDKLMSLLRQDIKDKRILKLIRMMLKAGVLEELEILRTDLGTPPGGILSPLLANVYLHELDKFIANRYEYLDHHRRKKAPLRIFICRYADDWCILINGTRQQAEAVKGEVTEYLGETLKLELSEEKTLITPVEKGFDFLGFNIRKYRDRVHVKPSLKAIRKLRDKVREITKTFFATDIDLGIMKLNYALRGFAEYYRRVYSKRIFQKLDYFVWWHVLRRAKRFIYGSSRYSTVKFLKQHYYSYSQDVFKMNRRHKGINLGIWSEEKKRAWMVQALRFYPIQYIKGHPQLNPYLNIERAKLEENRVLNRLFSNLAKYPLKD